MGTILTIASSKDGSGKTTLAQCLGVNLAVFDFRLIVIDTDANETFREWQAVLARYDLMRGRLRARPWWRGLNQRWEQL
jgi:cellulose biosynthesis protein BcsQ